MSTSEHEYEITTYIKNNPVMVLATADKDGVPHTAAVYVVATNAKQLYFITKNETQKFKNIKSNPNISLTIVNATENSTLQAQGRAHTISDPNVIELTMEKLTKVYARAVDWLPPLAKFRAGPYEVVEINITKARLATFKDAEPGDKAIFKEI